MKIKVLIERKPNGDYWARFAHEPGFGLLVGRTIEDVRERAADSWQRAIDQRSARTIAALPDALIVDLEV